MAFEAWSGLETPGEGPSCAARPSPISDDDLSLQPGVHKAKQLPPSPLKSPLFLRSGVSAEAVAQLDARWCIADLEDSVPASKKPAMRQWLRSLLDSGCFRDRHLMVRVNGFDHSAVPVADLA